MSDELVIKLVAKADPAQVKAAVGDMTKTAEQAAANASRDINRSLGQASASKSAEPMFVGEMLNDEARAKAAAARERNRRMLEADAEAARAREQAEQERAKNQEAKKAAATPPPLPKTPKVTDWQGILGGMAASASGAVAGGGGIGGAIGAAAGAGAAAGGHIGLAITAAGTVLIATIRLFHQAIEKIKEVAERAARTYARILQSGGQATGFVVQSQTAAGIMGVSPQEVWAFGAAMGYLHEQTAQANRIFTETNRSLTALDWGFKTLDVRLKSLGASVVDKAAPDLRKALDFAGKVVDGWAFLVEQHGASVKKWLGRVIDVTPVGGAVKALLTKAADMIGARDPGVAPDAPISTKRLPGSAWERIGMVIGSGGGVNYNQITASNTTKMVSLLNKLANAGSTIKGPRPAISNSP